MAEKGMVSEAFEQAAREVEAEVKRAIEYIESNIVPRARRGWEKVLRRLSDESAGLIACTARGITSKHQRAGFLG